ncbi:Fanconi anemia group J protein [Lobosporangium transversale]|nr:Fanconi anemia group J protein [Lobosporangium transversale]
MSQEQRRKRRLPTTLTSNSRSNGGTSSTSQSRLNVSVFSSDSDTANGTDDNSNHSGKKRFRQGYFTHKPSSSSKLSSSESASNVVPVEFVIEGIKVKFPFAPYESQREMMSKIVKALQTEENALLESPTGSGKSLALLCGALAWLESEKGKRMAIRAKAKQMELKAKQGEIVESPYFTDEKYLDTNTSSTFLDSTASYNPSGCGPCAASCGSSMILGEANDGQLPDSNLIIDPQPSTEPKAIPYIKCSATIQDDEAFKPTRKDSVAKGLKDVIEIQYEKAEEPSRSITSTGDKHPGNSTHGYRNIPKIYFGSRTVTGEGCYQKSRAGELAMKFTERKGGQNKIWDMEDLVKTGKSLRACPYFAARSMAVDAELVFCPYGYLIDPQIRRAMEINLDESIVILDEAHNIEDAAREAGGLEVVDSDLTAAAMQFGDMVKRNNLVDWCLPLRNLAEMFLSMLNDQVKFSIREYEQSTEIWTGQEMLANLDRRGVSRHTIHVYDRACQGLSKALKEQKDQLKELNKRNNNTSREIEGGKPKFDPEAYIAISPRTLRVMEGIITVLMRLMDPDLDCVDDYKVVLVESVARRDPSADNGSADDAESSDEAERGGGSSTKGKRKPAQRKTQTSLLKGKIAAKIRELKFWCMNPGLIFQPISSKVRSIILTSGTLSPMDTFASELQTSFKIQLEAGHIIQKSQVWAGALPLGPNGVKMDGTYRSASSYPYQDELGRVIERIITITPHGVLCFLSSYSLLDNLMARWRATGQYDRLCAIKKVIQEPRKAPNKIFDKTLRGFYAHIASHVEKGSNGGAIMFAVFRGKCSEGIDFTDSNCRAVLAVSIPFPGLHDLKIKLKKEYNDSQSRRYREHTQLMHHQSLQSLDHSSGNSAQSAQLAAMIAKRNQGRPLLNGNRWYEIQAFRAYNQAIGRCIRHRRDWGAMVLLDHRFSQLSNQQCLSKWVRPLVRTFWDFEQGVNDMMTWIKPLCSDGVVILEEVVREVTTLIEQAPGQDRQEACHAVQVTDDLSIDSSRQEGNDRREEAIVNSEVKSIQLGEREGKPEGDISTCEDTVGHITTDLEAKLHEPKNEDVDYGGPAGQDGSDINDWNNEWALDPADGLLDGANDNRRSQMQKQLCSDDIYHAVSEAQQHGADDDWGSDLEADVTAELDAGFESESESETQQRSNESDDFQNLDEGDNMQAHEAVSDMSTTAKRNSSETPGMSITEATALMPVSISSTNIDAESRAPSSQSVDSTHPHPKASSPLYSAFSSVRSLPVWPSEFPYELDVSNSLTKKSMVLSGLGSDIDLRVVCKVCSGPLLSCSERPKIKIVHKSMANEMVMNRKREIQDGLLFAQSMNQQTSVVTNDYIPNTNGTSGMRSLIPALKRSISNQSLEGVVSLAAEPSAGTMILVISKSNVKEDSETQLSMDELDCIWRPEDGLFYRRIVCAQCNRGCSSMSIGEAHSHLTIVKTASGNRVIPGWKGVIVVGRSDDSIAEKGSADELGTVWLTPGETRIL